MPGGDMASFAARLSIGRWATFRRRTGVSIDRLRASLEYFNTIVAVDENVEMAAAWTAIPVSTPRSHCPSFVRMYK
jgi:hypothetical protein